MNTGSWAGLFGQEAKYAENIEDTEEFHCESCNGRISEEEY